MRISVGVGFALMGVGFVVLIILYQKNDRFRDWVRKNLCCENRVGLVTKDNTKENLETERKLQEEDKKAETKEIDEDEEFILASELQKYSIHDPNYSNLLEVLGTPKLEFEG